jgi:hypothetical protein
MGALTGVIVARARQDQLVLGGGIGAFAALMTTYLAYHTRRRLPVGRVLGGLIEDGVVVGIGAFYVRRAIPSATVGHLDHVARDTSY